MVRISSLSPVLFTAIFGLMPKLLDRFGRDVLTKRIEHRAAVRVQAVLGFGRRLCRYPNER